MREGKVIDDLHFPLYGRSSMIHNHPLVAWPATALMRNKKRCGRPIGDSGSRESVPDTFGSPSVGRLARLLRKDLEDHDGVEINTIDNSPCLALVVHPQLMTAISNRQHRPGMRQGQKLPLLKQPEEESSLCPGLLREWRRPNLAVQPNQGSIIWNDTRKVYVISDIDAGAILRKRQFPIGAVESMIGSRTSRVG